MSDSRPYKTGSVGSFCRTALFYFIFSLVIHEIEI
jgi:hypothetical protein